jgi:RNA polymerase sigma-70 factor, ECF subfamily
LNLGHSTLGSFFTKKGILMKDLRTWFPWEPPSGSLGSTSPSLVDAYRAGDSESWKRLEDIYGPVVYHIFLSRVAIDDRDDVFQEVFSAAWKNRERFNKVPGRPSFRAWLHRIAANTVLNHRRGKRRHQCAAPVGGEEHREMIEQLTVHDPAMLTADESEASGSPAEDSWNEWLDADRDIIVEGVSPDGDHIRILVRRQVLKMVLHELESQPRTRDLALRQIINGESAEAAARALGVTTGAAYTAKSRVLKRIREILSELGEPVDDGRESPEQFDGVEP